MLICEIYACVTLSITTMWVYSAREYSLRTLAWAMFFPGLFAPWFSEDPFLWQQILGYNQLTSAFVCSLLAILCVILALSFTYGINLMMGWGTPVGKRDVVSYAIRTTEFPIGFFKAAGEEIGWRCYLLPCLLTHYSAARALLLSGIIWALYHVPVMILLTQKFRVRHRWKTVVVQSAQCILAAFPFGYVAMCSGFSVWAPSVMHYAWNYVNPLVFGSIYTQQSGRMVTGEQWLINGEGLAGCLAFLPFVVYVLSDVWS